MATLHDVHVVCVFYRLLTCFVLNIVYRVILAISVTDNLERQTVARGMWTAYLRPLL